MKNLATSQDLRSLCQDLSELAGVSPTCTQWLRESASTTPEIRTHPEMQQLVSSLLVRLIGMEVALP